MESSHPGGMNATMRNFARNKMGMVGLAMLLLAIALAVLAPVVAPYNPAKPPKATIMDIYLPPSADHLFGTDDAGQDVLTNFLYGARVSLMVGFFASFIDDDK